MCMLPVSIIIIKLIFSVGNFMYFSATSKYMLLGSRFVVGERYEGVHGLFSWSDRYIIVCLKTAMLFKNNCAIMSL